MLIFLAQAVEYYPLEFFKKSNEAGKKERLSA